MDRNNGSFPARGLDRDMTLKKNSMPSMGGGFCGYTSTLGQQIAETRLHGNELDHDIGLHFKSVSAKNAHAGSRTEYQAAKRQVVHSSWCTTVRGFWIFKKTRQVKHEPEILPVPESICTEEALREYVKGKKPLWL